MHPHQVGLLRQSVMFYFATIRYLISVTGAVFVPKASETTDLPRGHVPADVSYFQIMHRHDASWPEFGEFICAARRLDEYSRTTSIL